MIAISPSLATWHLPANRPAMGRCYFRIVQYAKWLTGDAVPALAQFAHAGFCQDGLQIPYGFIKPDHPLWRLQQIRTANFSQFSFAIPSAEALAAIKSLSPLVEVGAGTGCWSRLLANLGADIIATDRSDLASSTNHVQQFWLGKYFPIEKLDANQAVQKYPDRNVLAVWPTGGVPWMHEAAREMKPGARLALVHAGKGGCVGDDGLFDYLRDNFTLENNLSLPRWPGMQDRLGVWKKVTNNCAAKCK